MAAVVSLGNTFNTTDGTKTVVATPAIGDLVVILTAHSGNVALVPPTDNNPDGSGTYTRIRSQVKASGVDGLQAWVRNSLIGVAASTTFTHAPGTTTGGGLQVFKVTGMSAAGLAAVRQSGGETDIGAGAVPAPVLGPYGAALASNPLVGLVFGGPNPETITPPASFTEVVDTGWATPTKGVETVSIDSGITLTTITWGSANTSAQHGSIVVELDAAAYAAQVRMVPLSVPWMLRRRGRGLPPLRAQAFEFPIPAAGGTTFEIFPSGATSPAGTLAKHTTKLLAGATSPAGMLTKSTSKAFTGVTSPAGALVKAALKLLGGQTSPAGVLLRLAGKTLTGQTSPVGTLTRLIGKGLGGATSPAGTLSRAASKLLAGSTGPVGALTRQTSKGLAGQTSPSGSLTTAVVKLLAVAGSIAPAGTLTRLASKALAGQSSPAGTLARSTSKTVAGQTSPVGTLQKEARKVLAGVTAPQGALLRLAGKVLAGTTSPQGTLRRDMQKTLVGAVQPQGSLLKNLARTVAGAIAPVGALSTIVVSATDRVFRFARAALKWRFGEPETRWRTGRPRTRRP